MSRTTCLAEPTPPPRRTIDPHRLRAAVELYQQGWLPAEIALAMGCSPATVYRWLAKIQEIRDAGTEGGGFSP